MTFSTSILNMSLCVWFNGLVSKEQNLLCRMEQLVNNPWEAGDNFHVLQLDNSR